MKVKKILAAILATACALSSVWGLVACNDDTDNGSDVSYSETYVGSVSEKEYVTTDAAVKGFLEEELSGTKIQAVFVSYEKEEQLNNTQIAALDLGDAAEGLISVEKGKVEYSEKKNDDEEINEPYMTAKAKNAAATSETEVTYFRTVYILGYTGMFKFFVPPVQDGETITASYFSSTFKAEDYINCTMNVTMTRSYSYDGNTYTSKNQALAKATANMLYEYGTRTSSEQGGTYKYESYISDSPQGIYTVDRSSNELSNELGDFEARPMYDRAETINEYFMQWFDQRFGKLDHTYFVKTSTGYELNSEKYEQFARDYYDYEDEEDLSLSYIINVSEGRMADVYMKVEMGGDLNEMSVKFSNFGTTVINVPDNVKSLIPA